MQSTVHILYTVYIIILCILLSETLSCAVYTLLIRASLLFAYHITGGRGGRRRRHRIARMPAKRCVGAAEAPTGVGRFGWLPGGHLVEHSAARVGIGAQSQRCRRHRRHSRCARRRRSRAQPEAADTARSVRRPNSSCESPTRLRAAPPRDASGRL